MTKPLYFTLEELVYSKKALDNKIQNNPSWEAVEKLNQLAVKILDPLRKKIGRSITVTSGFRSKKLNALVKGSGTSQHLKGESADITCSNNRLLFDTAKAMIESGEITVGQLIWEYGTKKSPSWVHISLPDATHKNQILYIGI